MMELNSTRLIYCMQCGDVNAQLVSGRDVYPHRPDLWARMFWQCPHCKNFVGTHKKTGIELGCIPNKEMKIMRGKIHNLLDPLWKTRQIDRKQLYSILSNKLGYEYHTAQLRTLEDAYKVEQLVQDIIDEYRFKTEFFWQGAEKFFK